MSNMNLVDLLFSFQGRINRAKYWLAVLIYVGVCVVAGLLLVVLELAGAYFLGVLVAAVIYLGVVISSLSMMLRRLHDRDKSGWWLLVFWLLPALLSAAAKYADSTVLHVATFALCVWAIVELGCLRGTVGPNQYGPDPLAAPAGAPA